MTGVLHIVLARKPIEGTITENCLRWGCGALWIDGCRIAHSGPNETRLRYQRAIGEANQQGLTGIGYIKSNYGKHADENSARSDAGRYPANFILDLEVARCLDLQSGNCGDHGTNMRGVKPTANSVNGMFSGRAKTDANCYHDSGSASRFFFNFSEQEADE